MDKCAVPLGSLPFPAFRCVYFFDMIMDILLRKKIKNKGEYDKKKDNLD